MKKYLALMIAGCLALNLSGCMAEQPEASSDDLPGTSIALRDNLDITAMLSMRAIVLPTFKESVTTEDGTALFSLSFPQAQINLGNTHLEERIISDLQSRNDSLLTQASEIESQAQNDYPESEFWNEYFIDLSYEPTRLDNTVLSLFSNVVSYSGGAHPTFTTDSVTYDLESGNALWLDDVLVPGCSSDTIYQLVLQSLSGQANDLYYDYADALGDRFTGTLHSIQDWYFSRNGLCFHFAPYDIAPYSSGTIIAELPYDTLNGVLKEQYFPTEITISSGSMYAETFLEDDRERFTNIADVLLWEGGTEVLLYSDAIVTDVRIETGYRYDDNEQYIPGSTVFAANVICVGDAIHLTANLEYSQSLLRLIYHADGQEYSAFITYDALGDAIILSSN